MYNDIDNVMENVCFLAIIAMIYADSLYRLSRLTVRHASARPHPSVFYLFNIHARALDTVRDAIRTVCGGGKVIKFRNGVRADGFSPFLPVRRAHFTMRILRDSISIPSAISQRRKRTVNWNACTRRNASSTDRPTGRSFIVICLHGIISYCNVKTRVEGERGPYLRIPLGSIR